jgi:hypothetical protein
VCGTSAHCFGAFSWLRLENVQGRNIYVRALANIVSRLSSMLISRSLSD